MKYQERLWLLQQPSQCAYYHNNSIDKYLIYIPDDDDGNTDDNEEHEWMIPKRNAESLALW